MPTLPTDLPNHLPVGPSTDSSTVSSSVSVSRSAGLPSGSSPALSMHIRASVRFGIFAIACNVCANVTVVLLPPLDPVFAAPVAFAAPAKSRKWNCLRNTSAQSRALAEARVQATMSRSTTIIRHRGETRYSPNSQSKMLTCLMPAWSPSPTRSMVSNVLGWLSPMVLSGRSSRVRVPSSMTLSETW